MHVPVPSVSVMLALGTMLGLGNCSSLERSLIFPGAATQGRAEADVPLASTYELIPLTTESGTKIVAQFGRALDAGGQPLADSATRPTVIYFYGNGSCLAYSRDQFDGFRRLGVNVIIPEFPGYGMSGGSASERACYEAADAVYAHLLTRGDIDPAQLVAAGWSMGAAVAIDLVSRRPLPRLVTISAFTTMPAVAKSVAPWAPTSLIVRSRFDNAAKLPAVSCPVLLVHGTFDNLVPHAMADELATRVAHSSLRRLDLAAGHNDIFQSGGATLWREIGEFLFAAP